MASLITKSEPFASGGQAKNLVEIRCDLIEDVTPANGSWSLGSIAWECKTGKIYGLDSEGNWNEQKS